MNIKKSILYTGIIVLFVILQSTVLSEIRIMGVRPDFTLIFLVFFSHVTGPMHGKIIGFIVGLLKDFLSLAPFGFHGIIDTTIGHIYGFTREKVYIDPITIPLLLAVSATVIKALGSFVLFALFLPENLPSVFGVNFLIEIAMNGVAAPFIYALLRVSGLVKERTHTMFG
ncbi:MAG: rod shape-determining protein MreD [Spirochaetaceae bacterium]